MLNNVVGFCEWFSHRDDCDEFPHIQIMENMRSDLVSKKGQKRKQVPIKLSLFVDQMAASSEILDEESDEDEDFHVLDQDMDS